MKAIEFAKSHDCDKDWIDAMGDREINDLPRGTKVIYSGYQATVKRHYVNGLFEIMLDSGLTTASYSELTQQRN
jgi:hypothetical protein